MSYQFESPGKLEERIAANMADESDDLSLGVGRKASSFASISIATEDFSMSRNDPNETFHNSLERQQSLWESSGQDESFQDTQTGRKSPWSESRQTKSVEESQEKQQSPWTFQTTQSRPSPSHPIDGTSTPKAYKPDQERMKAYLINSVKTINPLREAQLRHMTPRRRNGNTSLGRTPLPGPSRLRLDDDPSEENDADSFISDISSTRDLTLPARFAARANTSFPGVGAGEGINASSARVDPSRLQGYLHKINIQLESENLTLKEEKEALKRQFNRALLDCEKFRMQVEAKNDGSKQQTGHVNQGTMTHNDRVEELQREVESLRDGHEELNDMLDERDAELEAARRKLDEVQESESLKERIQELEDELVEEREALNQERKRFDQKIQEAMDEATTMQLVTEKKLIEERDRARDEVEKIKLTSARTRESADIDLSVGLEEREAEAQQALQKAHEMQEDMERRLEEDAVAFEELENELDRVKEDLLRCDEELNGAKDQIMDLQIAAEEKESDNIKLNMQLRQAKESTELHQLREKVVLLEAQLEGVRQESVRQLTPLHKNISNLRRPVDTPKSPGELSSASWLNQESTLGDKSVLRNLQELRAKVDQAHAQTDEKVAALGTGQLAQKMVELQDQMEEKEEEIKRLQEREERWRKRIQKIRCQHCQTRLSNVDLDQSIMSRASMSMTTTQTDGDVSLAKSTRSGLQKEQIVAEIAEQLNELKAKWAVDRARLDDEREALDAEKELWTQEKKLLQTENHRLKTERENRGRETKENVKRMQDGTLKDLSRARRIIGEFERELRDDCLRFQEAVKNSRGLDESALELEQELSRTKKKLLQVERELKSKVEIFERLQNELFEKSQMDQNLPLHVQRLELEVQKFSLDVESLRNERNSILEERQKLYKRHRSNQEEYLNMHQELKGAREAITAHQMQLDEQIETIENLHQTLTKQNENLEALHDDRDRLKGQRREILTDVASLETDLRRVREESKRFGSDLEKLRAEQEWTKREGNNGEKQSDQVKQLQESIIDYQERETAIRGRHRAECQGLLLQVRYEKAKFMREVDLRRDLIQQKGYILNVLGGMQLVDSGTSQFLANIRSSRNLQREKQAVKSNSPPIGRFKVVACAVVAICRAKIMAENWRKTTQVKRALRDAHQAAKVTRQTSNILRPLNGNTNRSTRLIK